MSGWPSAEKQEKISEVIFLARSRFPAMSSGHNRGVKGSQASVDQSDKQIRNTTGDLGGPRVAFD